MKIREIKSIHEIPYKKYEGYIWKSDKQNPTVLHNEEYDFSSVQENPFVVEALLYCRDEDLSIMVKHTGKYVIKAYDLKEWGKKSKNVEVVEKEYLPHRLGSRVSKLMFSQFWEEEADSLCEGMSVLKLKANIFKGFKTNNYDS